MRGFSWIHINTNIEMWVFYLSAALTVRVLDSNCIIIYHLWMALIFKYYNVFVHDFAIIDYD